MELSRLEVSEHSCFKWSHILGTVHDFFSQFFCVAHLLSRIFINMSISFLEEDLVYLIATFIGEPDGFFAFKSASRDTNQLIPNVFTVSNLSEIIQLSICLPEDKLPIRLKIKTDQVLTTTLLRFLVVSNCRLEIIAALASSIPGVEMNALVERDIDLSILISTSACLIKNIDLGFKLFMMIKQKHDTLNLRIPNPCHILYYFAAIGSDNQLYSLLQAFPTVFTPTLAGSIVNIAIKRGHEKTVRFLYACGINFGRSFNGKYPIQAAIESGDHLILRLVWELQGETKLRYRHGELPLLHLAAAKENVEMFSFLLRSGADARSRDFYGQTVDQLVRRKIHTIKRMNLKSDESEAKLICLQRIAALLQL